MFCYPNYMYKSASLYLAAWSEIMSLPSNGRPVIVYYFGSRILGVGEIRYPRAMRVTLRTPKVVKPLVHNVIMIIIISMTIYYYAYALPW